MSKLHSDTRHFIAGFVLGSHGILAAGGEQLRPLGYSSWSSVMRNTRISC